jgi:alkanesulfonate monooxygenase SsuD/methylene tetrahydromethanopterin reductase-like flavin-dependent oxidoreductase (luciferase family)
MRALRRDRVETEDDFPRDVAELQRLLGRRAPASPVAMPGRAPGADLAAGLQPVFGALAAERGLPYAFASHFAPRCCCRRSTCTGLFQPSAALAKPYVMIGVPLIAAPTDDEAEYLASSTYQRVLGILTGDRRACSRPSNFMAGCNRRSARPSATSWPPP